MLEEEADKARSALVPVIAHNIRNPLMAIKEAATLLRDEFDIASEGKALLANIAATTDRLSRWTESLLMYLNPLQPRVKEGVLLEVAVRTSQTMAEQMATKRITIKTAPCEQAPRCNFDEQLVEQALYGLILNAVQEAPAGSRIELRAWAENGHCHLAIADEGPGMRFEPVTDGEAIQAGPTTKANGTGLGIPFAAKIARIHGGQLRFEPGAGGKGTRAVFTVRSKPLPEAAELNRSA